MIERKNKMEIKENAFLICTSENKSSNSFDIYARVTKVDQEHKRATLDKYQKSGALRIKSTTLDFSDIEHFYRPMTESEKNTFANTIFSRINKKTNLIHLGGDRTFSDIEKIEGAILDTLTCLSPYISKDIQEKYGEIKLRQYETDNLVKEGQDIEEELGG